MGADGLEGLDRTVQLTHQWINELDRSLGWKDRHRAFRLLRAVLHGLRDCLPLVEGAHLASQLPTLLRGIYFERWRPGHLEGHRWTLQRFLGRIEGALRGDPDPIASVDEAVKAVFALLAARISAGEIDHVVACLPTEIRGLWVESGAVAD